MASRRALRPVDGAVEGGECCNGSGRSSGCPARFVETALQRLAPHRELLVGFELLLDPANGVEHRCVVAPAEALPDLEQRKITQLPREIDGELPCLDHRGGAAGTHQLLGLDAVLSSYELLDPGVDR